MRASKRNALRRKLLTAAVAACFAGKVAYANPVGPSVVRGQVSFATQGSTLSVTNTPGAIINWQQFSIQANEATRFIQQSASSAVLNRVVGIDPSRILGTLQSNGRVFLINPNGILFGAGARIDVGGLVASTLKLSNEDFIAGRMNFVGDVGTAAAVINQGSINAAGGRVYLIGQAVENQGVINAPNGDIVLAAGHSVRVTEGASPGVQVEIVAPADRTVNVSELVYSPRGIYAGLVRNSGVIQANSVVRGADGSITLKASHELALEPGSKVAANGLDGGRVVMEAQQAVLAGRVEALGSAGAIELAAREVTVQGEVHSTELQLRTEDLTIADGSLRANSGAMAISGNFVQTGGDMAPGSSTIAVGGNWRREGGSFDSGTSTVEFTDASKVSTISGDNTFYNFTSVTPSKHLVFEAGATQTVLGDFTLRGEKFHLVDLRSSDPGGEQWKLDARGNVDVKFVHLGDAWNIGPTPIKALPSNSHGNNTGWDTDPVWVAVAAGNWSTDANWDTGVRPGVADTVTFNATSTQNSTVDAGFAGTIANLNINAGYTGTIDLARSLTVNSAYNQADGNFAAAGQALAVNGTYTLSGGNFTASSATTTLGGGVTVSGGTFNANGGSIALTGGSTTANFGTATLNNVTISKGAATTLTVTGTMNVGGDLTISSVQNINTGTIAVVGNVITTDTGIDGTGTVSFVGGGVQTLSAAGGTGALPGVQINKSGGTLTIQDTINVGGDWTYTAGTVDAGTSTIAFINGAATVNSGAMSFNNVILSSGSGGDLTVTGTMNVAGNLAITTVSDINGGTIAVAGDVSSTDTDLGGSGTILFTGAGNQTVSAAGGTGELPNIHINKSGGTLTLQDINVDGDWTYTAGTVDVGTTTVVFRGGDTIVNSGAMSFNNVSIGNGNAAVLTVNGTMNVAGNLAITLVGNINGGTIAVAGNVTATDSTVDGTGVVLFTGAGTQTLSAAGGTGGLPNVQVNKSGGTLTIQDTINIDGNWTHTAGTVDAGTSTVVFTDAGTIDSGAMSFNNVSINAGSSSLDVTGTMDVNGNLTITSVQGINSGTIAVAGNVTTTDTNVTGSATVLFDGAGAQILSAGGGTGALPNVQINKSGGTLTIQNTISVDGDWTHTAGTVDAGTGTVVFTDAGTVNAGAMSFNNVTVNTGSSILGVTGTVDVNGNLVITSTQSINNGTITVGGNVSSADGAVAGTAALVLDGTGNQTITAAATDLPNGTVTINKASGTASLGSNIILNGAGQDLTVTAGLLDLTGFNLTVPDALTVAATGTLQLQGGETISAASVNLNAGSTVVYNGTTGPFTLKNFAYSNLTIDGGAGTVFSFPANLTTINTLTLNNSITSLAGFNLTATTLANNATLRLQGNETVTITNMDTNSGLVQYVGDGAGGLNSFTIKDFGAADYFNLAIAGVSGSETFTVASPLKLNGTLAHTTGTLNLGANVTTAAGTITSNDVVSLSANVLVDTTDAGALPGGATMSFAGTINADAAANNRTLTLTGGTAGNVTLSSAVGGTQPLQTLTITSANTASLPAVTTRNGGIDVTATAISLNGNLSTDSIATAGSVNLAGAVNLGAPVTIDTDAATTDANIAFNSNVNGAQALTLTSGTGSITMPANIGNTTPLSSLTVSTANALNFNGTTSVTGALNVTSGAITGGALTIGGDTTLNAGANAITLTNAGNDFQGAVAVSNTGANNVAITDSNGIQFAASALGSGTLAVNAGGAITQTGAITQAAGAGAASFTTGAAAITLTNAGNEFSGAVSLTNSGANNVALTDASALILGTSSVGNNLALTAGGSISQSGVLTVPGTSTFTLSAAGSDVLLDTAANDLTGAVSFAGTLTNIRDVAVRNVNAGATLPSLAGLTNLRDLTLRFDNAAVALPAATLAAGGDLVVTAGGAITQTGALVVPGTSTLSAGANAITLTDAGNDFQGAVTLSNSGANNVALTDANAIVLAASNVGSGTLTVTATGANSITQSGAIVQAAGAGAASFSTGAGAITLTNAANDFTGAVSLTNSGANNVALTDANALVLGASNVGSGTLTVNATGANSITQTGTIVQAAGAAGASFTTGAGVITLDTVGNDFTGVVTLVNSGANNVNIRDANALSVAGGTYGASLLLRSNGDLTQTGPFVVTGNGVFRADAGAIVLNDPGNDVTGAVTLINTGANNVVITDVNAIRFVSSSVGSGTLTVIAGGAITQGNQIVQAAGAGTASFTTGAAVITLTDSGNDFTGPVVLSNSGANAVSIRDTNALILAGGSFGGTFSAQSNGSLTQTGALVANSTASFTAGAGAITLTNAGNDFQGAVTLSNSGANNVALTDANALLLGASNVGSGTLTVTATGANTITQTGAIVQAAGAGAASFTTGAGAITLTNAANDFTGAVSLTNSGANNVALTDANAIVLGASNVGSGTLTVTATGANTITQTGAIVQAAGAGASFITGGAAITLTNAGNDFTGAVTLTNIGANAVSIRDTNALILAGGSFGGTFSAQSNGSLTQTGAIVVNDTASFTAGAGAITLTDAGNDLIGAVSLSNSGANNVAITDANAIVLGASNVGSGTLTVTATGANTITQTGAIVQAAGAGTASFTTGAAAITLTDAGNDFTGTVALSNSGANAVSIRDANALILAGGSIGGSFSAQSNGSLTQSGAIIVNDTASFTAGAGAITLTNAGNDFQGAVTLSNSGANNVALSDANAIVLAASNVGSGTLTVTATGANSITQTGAVVQAAGAGTATFTTGAGAITLTDAGNDFTGAVSLSNSGANNAALTDTNALILGASSVGNDLALTAGGSISQSGILTVPGTTSLTLSAAASDVVLDTAANDLTGAVSFAGTLTNIRDVSLRNVNAGATVPSLAGLTNLRDLTLRFDNAAVALPAATLAAGGDLVVTAGGAITQTGALVVPGTSTLSANANAITLTNAGNDFQGAVAVSNTGANNVAITDSNGIQFAASALGSGTLAVNAGGAITQTGAITQAAGAGAASFTTGAAAITLTNAGNEFSGAVSLTNSGANNVALTDASALILGTSSVGNNLALTAGGSISQSGVLTVPGTSTFTLSAAGSDVLLDTAANDLTGAVSFAGTLTNIRDVAVRNVNAGATLPSLAGLTNLRDLTLRFDNAAVALPAATLAAGGDLVVTAGGAITQTGALVVPGTSTLSAGANAITLTDAGNDFQGAVTLSNSGANNVALTDANAIVLAASNVGSGTLTVTATGANSITQSGAIVQAAGAGAASFSTGAGAITLTNAANDFTGAVSLTNSGANNVALTDANALVLGASNVGSGTLTVTATGANTITQTGAIVQAAGAGTASFTTGAGAITLTDAANDFTGAVSLTNSGANAVSIRDANALILAGGSIGGTFSAQSNGNLTQTGAIVANDTASFTAGAGAITLTDAGNDFIGAVSLSNSGANNVALSDANAIVLGASNVGSGTLTVTATGANTITQTGAIVQAAGAGAASFTTGAGAITLTNAANDFTGAVSLNNSGANNVALSDANAIVLGASNVGSGTLTVTATGANTITQTGAIVQAAGAGAASFTTGAGAITLTGAANDFTGAVSLTNSGANNVALSDANAIVLGASNVGSGTLTVTATGANTITQTGAIVQAAGAGAASFTTGAGAITLTDAANDFTGAVSLNNSGANSVALTDANAIVLAASNVGSGTLTVTATGANSITQSGAIVQAAGAGAASFSTGAGAITLTNAANDFTGAVSLTNSGANNVALTDANALVLGASNVGSGTLTVTATGANTITQTGAIVQAAGAGTASFTTGAGAITLTDAANDFTGAVSLTNSGANAVSIRDANALILAGGSIGGTFSAQSNGNLTQTGAIVANDTASFTAGAGAITLTDAGNDFIGAVSLSNSGANNVALSDANAIVLGASNVGSGTLTVTATGANTITQTGAIVQAAGAGAASFTTGAGAITLTNAANDFTGAVSLNNSGANNVALSDANAIVLGASNVGSGTLTVTATGANTITQTGAIVQAAGAGAASFTTGAGAITLTGAANDFTGAVSLTNSGANNVALSDANAIVLGASNVGSGTLTVNAGAAITQAGAIVQAAGAGAATFATGAGAITLNNAGNDFSGAVSLSNSGANNVALTDANALILGASSVGNNLALTAGGTISQSGVLTVPGSSTLTLTAAGSDVLLDTQANDLAGAVSFAGTLANLRDVGLRNVNAGATVPALVGLTNLRDLTLRFDNAAVALPAATLAAGGDLTVIAGGAITQTGVLVVPGTSTLSANANAITLTNVGNDFQGAVTLTNSGANNVALTDTNALILGASTVGGTLTLIAGAGGAGALTQSGVLSASALTASAAGGIDLASSANDIATVSLTNTVSGDVAYLSNRAAGVTLSGSNVVGAWSATEQGVGGLTVGAAGINTAAGDVVLAASAGPMTVSGAITSVSGNLTLTAGANVIVDDNVTTTGNVQFTSGAAIDINPVAPITVSGNDVTLTAVDLNLGNPAAAGSLSLTATDSLTLTASNALNVRGGAAGGAFVRVEGTGITINAETVLFAGGAGAGAHGAAVANAGDVMLTGTSSITFSAGAGANADGVLSAPTWNVTITTPSCVGCNVLLADPFTNPPSEAGIHALTLTVIGFTPPPVVVPVDPAPAIDASTLIVPQPGAEQQMRIDDQSEVSVECQDIPRYASATLSALRRRSPHACQGADAGLVEIKRPGGL